MIELNQQETNAILQYLQTRPINEAYSLFVMLIAKVEALATDEKNDKSNPKRTK